jgi:hypothetical protein
LPSSIPTNTNLSGGRSYRENVGVRRSDLHIQFVCPESFVKPVAHSTSEKETGIVVLKSHTLQYKFRYILQ